jgi:16S rRNA pseudouridine516 synthase
MRLDNFLTKALSISRSEATKLIKDKKILVNDNITTKKVTYIDEQKDVIKYNNEIITYKEFIYIMLNKPKGYLSATRDKNEKTVIDLIDIKREIFPVGRLDKDTEGLMLLTNNGKYAHFLTSPNHHVEKKYYVELENEIKDEDINLFCNGLEIRDGKDELYITKQAKFDKLTSNSCYVYITEGKFHQIKRMFEKLNNKVIYLKRVQFGDIKLDETLQLGEYRELTEEEIILFKQGK